jgi:uncharacterized SAM-binding protein YcdF (DUF218 family)
MPALAVRKKYRDPGICYFMAFPPAHLTERPCQSSISHSTDEIRALPRSSPFLVPAVFRRRRLSGASPSGTARFAVTAQRRWIVAIGVPLVLLGMFIFVFLHLGDWLVVEDPLAVAHAIVVLSGELPNRSLEAARLYRQDEAAQVWVSQGLSPANALARMNIAFIGEDFYNQKVLMANGVPADAIRVLEMPSANTEEEVDQIARDCRRDQAHTVIIVTSRPHTRRVRLIWSRRVGNDPLLIFLYMSDDSFDAAHWWRVSTDALDVVREWLGIANAAFGFPARPASH